VSPEEQREAMKQMRRNLRRIREELRVEPPAIPTGSVTWLTLRDYFEQLTRSIPAVDEPQIPSFPGEPWKEHGEWESWAEEADADASEAIEHLLKDGSWPTQRGRNPFSSRLLARVETARDLCDMLSIPLAPDAPKPMEIIPQPRAPARAIIYWLLTTGWQLSPGAKIRYEPNPWSKYP
jgi:hypothetical protein